jgi:hypothetical protein
MKFANKFNSLIALGHVAAARILSHPFSLRFNDLQGPEGNPRDRSATWRRPPPRGRLENNSGTSCRRGGTKGTFEAF